MSPMSEHADESVTSIASARSALISILGELVAPYHQPVRTAALLYALTGVGFGESASRQAIARAGAPDSWPPNVTGERRSGP